MASRILAASSAFRAIASPSSSALRTPAARSFRSSAARLNDTATTSVTTPVRRPVGAFRGGMIGFLLGTSAAAYGTYYYVLEEYRLANEMLTEDIYALQAAVQRIHNYVGSLEEKVDAMQKKK
ncbi:MAG: hypothetical protein LQ340_006394 [Diploschistes diacapsis]|nr:MAG: hypothetical protein LQ340_006394 [Diploschistes diacapsis]